MIRLEDVAARRRPLALARLSYAWGPGVHAVVGSRDDGVTLLLDILAGAVRPRSGRVTIFGKPAADADVRTQVARVLLEPVLPDALRVDEAMAWASSLRGEPPREAAVRLRVLGIEGLASRTIRSLSIREERAVALAEAVTSSRVRVILIEEPLLSVDARTVALLPEQLRARAAAGCAVLVATASRRDAAELADDFIHLRRGALVVPPSEDGGPSGDRPGDFACRVVARDANAARALVATLAHAVHVEGIAQEGAQVVAHGRDREVLARAVGRAIVAANVEVSEMRSEQGDVPGAESSS